MSDPLQTIGASNEKTPEYRELTNQELFGNDFSDYFRMSLTLRMSRDDAIVLRHKIEGFISNEMRRDTRVYLGTRNQR